MLTVLALCVSALVGLGAAPASAVQATGHDAPVWTNGWSWTYTTSFRYVADGTDVTINESVVYAVAGTETFNGHDAYKLTINGTITGGSGTVDTGSVGTATLKNFSGTVSGTRYVRRSDLALLREQQHQHLNATATVGIISQGITADIDLTLTPSPSWKTRDFPLNAGDVWHHDEQIAYTGGFTYDAGSLGGSGSSPFDGTLPFVAPANVTAATISAGGNPSLATDLVTAVNADGSMSDTIWWSPSFKNDAKEILQLPLDGASLTINRLLASASVPAPSVTMSESVVPSLTCAGGQVTVSGQLGTFAAGVPVTVRLDQSQATPGLGVSAATTTGSGGSYSAVLTVPAEADGLDKAGSRANWGILVSAGGATNVATVVVTRQDCSTLTYTGATSAPHGGSATVSAQLTDLTGAGAGGRTVTFALSGGASVDATTNAAGVATASLPVAGPVRSATITTTYAGSGDLTPAGDFDAFEVAVVPTTTAVVPSASPATVGDPLTFTATVTPALGSSPAAGAVQFRIDGNDFGAAVTLDGSGAATSPSISNLPLGNHTVSAVYGGDASFGGSTSPTTSFLVRNPPLPTTTTQTVSPGNAAFGQALALSASVAAGSGGTPTGTVTWSEGGTALATATLDGSGVATATLSSLSVGSHSVVATYAGDDVYGGSVAAPRNVSVAKADVEVGLVATDTTTVSGEAVGYTASVSVVAPGGGTPNGTVQLLVDGNPSGSPVGLMGGVAAFPPVTAMLAGSHTVAAVYAGSASYRDGQDSLTQQVSQADTLTSVVATPSPSHEGQNVAITANVAAVAPGSGSPTGTVTFTANGDVIGGGSLTGGQVTVNVSDLAAGTYSIVATYAGGAAYGGSQSDPVSQTVIAGTAIVSTSATLTSSANPSTYGELVSFAADVDAEDGSAPAGAVQFSLDGADFGSPVPVDGRGVAESAALASPDPGDHTVIATFVPEPGFSGGGAILTQTVAAAGVDLDVTSSHPTSDYGQSVTFTASVGSQQFGTGTPTGFVQFVLDGQPLGDARELTGGVATSPSVSDLRPGDHSVAVVYSGEVHFVSALASITQSVSKVSTATALALSATSTSFGQPVTLTATVDPGDDALGSPGGSVTFLEGSTTLATVPVSAASGSNAVAALVRSDLGVGSHVITAVYSGTSSFATSTSPVRTLDIARQVTTIKADAAVVRLTPLGLPLGQLRVTLSSATGPVAGVPIVFRIGGATVCTSSTSAAGVATCNAASQLVALVLFNGYTATFAGNAGYSSSTAQGVVLK